MPRSSSPFYVPKEQEPDIVEEIHLRFEAQKRKTAKAFNPELGSTPAEAQAKVEEIQQDINEYGKYVYGLEAAPHHRFWNDAVDNVVNRKIRQNKILMMAPPHSAKSTWNSLIRVTHFLGQHPDEQLLFMTSSDDMAQTFAGAVRTTLAESERHREIFSDPGCRPNRRRGWSGQGLFLRGLPVEKKDPNYKAVGYGMTIMGARAKGIIMDDVLDQKQAQSEAECRRAIAYYDQTVVPRLHTTEGWLVAVMTRYAEGDLGGHFLKLNEAGGDWLVLKTPLEAEKDDPMGRLPGESLWPQQFPPEFIKATKLRMQLAEYNLVYQCDPTSMGGDIFTSEKYFKPLPENFWQEIAPFCFIGQAIDLAFSQQKRTAFSVILTFAVDRFYNMYILHIERSRMNIVDSEERIYELARVCKPRIVGIETENFHDKLIRGMVIRLMKRLMINVQLIKPDSDKIKRARLPAGRAEHGFVYIDWDAPWAREFVSECFVAGTPIQVEQVLGAQRRLYTGELVVLDTPRGRIETTPNHPFWTDQGWQRAEALTESSQILYIPEHGTKEAVYRGTIDELVRTQFPDVFEGCRDSAWALLERSPERIAQIARRLEAYVRFDLSCKAGDIDSDRIGVSSGTDRRRRYCDDCAVRARVESRSIYRQYDRSVDRLAYGQDPRSWSMGSPSGASGTQASRVEALLSVRDGWADPRRFMESLAAVLDYQETACGACGRILRSSEGAGTQDSEARTYAQDSSRDSFPQYQRVEAVSRRSVINEPVYNLATATETYKVRGYVVHNCMGFPNMRYKDQVDAFSLAALIVQDLDEAALKVAERRAPIMVEHVMRAS